MLGSASTSTWERALGLVSVSMSTFWVLPVLACRTWIERERDERKKRKGKNPPAKRSMMEGGRGRVIESRMVTGSVVLGGWRWVVLGSWGRVVYWGWGRVVGRLYRMVGKRVMWRLGVEGERFRVVVGRRFRKVGRGFGLVGFRLKMEACGLRVVGRWFRMLMVVDGWFWMVRNGFWMIGGWFWMVSRGWLIVYWGVVVLLALVLNCGLVTVVVCSVGHDLRR